MNKNIEKKKSEYVNVLIVLIVTAIVVAILMLPPVKEFIISMVEIGGDKLILFTNAHPYISSVCCLLFIVSMGVLSAICGSDDLKNEYVSIKDDECEAYVHTYKCGESSCEKCNYRMQKKPVVSISDLIKTMYSPERYTFYLNDEIVDLDTLYDNPSSLDGFEFEDGNVVRLYN